MKESLERTWGAVLGARENQGLPFERVVELMNPRRNAAHAPLFQVMLAWQSNDAMTFDLLGLKASALELPTFTANFDLTLDLAELDRGIVGQLNYATALFDSETAERNTEYLRQALSQLAANVQVSVAAINLLPPEEYRQLVVEWNDTTSTVPPEQYVHELFEDQVKRTPGATAVVYEKQSLSYAALNARDGLRGRICKQSCRFCHQVDTNRGANMRGHR